jgi:hypothetical protein
MHLSWLAKQNAELIALSLFIVMLIAAEVGYRFGSRWHPKIDPSGKGHFGIAQGVVLTLMGLLLAFTFNMSAQRFDTRRQLVLTESNALAGLYTRSGLLPETQRENFREYLLQYTDLRLSTINPDSEAEKLQEVIKASNRLQQEMWALIKDSRPDQNKSAEWMVGPLVDTFAIQRSRLFAYEGRVPDTIVWMLMGAAVIASTSVGYSGGLERHRGLLAKIVLALTISCVIMVMLSLDRPRGKILSVSQEPLMQVREAMNQDIKGIN